MKDWLTLATEFLERREKAPVELALHRDSTDGTSEVLTKPTQPLPAGDCPRAEGVSTREFGPPEVPTKLTKPSSGGVVSVLSVLLERDEFDDRVTCTNCRNYRYGHCHQHIRAGIGNSSHLPQDFAVLPQRCPAYGAKV